MLAKIILGVLAGVTSLLALAGLGLGLIGVVGLLLPESCESPEWCVGPSDADIAPLVFLMLAVGLTSSGIALLSSLALRRRMRADYLATRAPRTERRRYERQRR